MLEHPEIKKLLEKLQASNMVECLRVTEELKVQGENAAWAKR